MSHLTSKKTPLALAALALPLLIAAGTASGQTLVFCSEGSPETFYPGINTTGTSFDASGQIYSRVVDFERGGTTVVPGLAEKWTISPDGLTYTFHLRKGVKWHSNKLFKPTRDFNADDMLFMFERQWKENDPYFKVTSSNHSYFNDMGMPKLLKSVDKVDEYTVKIELNRPEAPFLSNLAMEYAGVQSKEYAIAMLKAGTPEKIDQEPIGTGPFMLVQYQKDAVIRYKAFPQYWGGKAKIDDLVFSITPDASVRWAKLQKGECHVMPYPNPAGIFCRLRYDLSQPAVTDIVRVKIYDVAGAVVRSLNQAGPFTYGGNELEWDLLDRRGRPVANGVYVFKAEAQSSTGSHDVFRGKIAVLR